MHFPLDAALPFAIVLRPVSEDDLPFLEALYASTRAEEVAATGWPVEMQRQFLHQQHAAQHAHYQAHFGHAAWRILEQAGQPIGRLYWDEKADDLHIIDIALVPSMRGTGLGGALLRDLASHAARSGKGLTVFVEQQNPARRLYQRLGFKPVENHGIYEFMRRAAGAPIS